MLCRICSIVAAVVVVIVLGLAWPSRAATPPVGPPIVPPTTTAVRALGTLDARSPQLHFSGTIENPTPLPLVDSPVQPVCAAECEEFTFETAAHTPFLVGLKGIVPGAGSSFNADDGFDLYVYGPSGTLVASSTGIGSNGQSVSVSSPAQGRYTIVVNITYDEDPNLAYSGEVRLMAGDTWKPPAPKCATRIGSVTACVEMPVLRAVPAYDLAVGGLPPVASTPLGFPLPATVPTSNSCYVDESLSLDNPSVGSIEHPVQRCLRFTSDVQNVGAGPLEVRLPWLTSSGGPNGTPASGFLPGQCEAEQVLMTDQGSALTRPAGACEFHAAHGHFHYKDLISFTLYRPGPQGTIGPKVASSLKESFCLADDDYYGYGQRAHDGARQFVGQPGCNIPSQTSIPGAGAGAAGAWVTEGVSPGWGDVYTWDTPDQYIDVSSAGPGTYDLVEETNPAGALMVDGPTHTCALTTLQLTSTSVHLLSTTDSITCPS